jgi:CRISPR/Cas system-associated endoribonuclease Cas2
MKIQKGEVVKAVLATIGVAGIVAVGAACPGLFALVPSEYRRRYPRKTFLQAARRLEGDYYYATKQGNRWIFRLTEKGRLLLEAYEFGQKSLAQNRWDGKWHVLIFDIPEKHRYRRDRVRQTLLHLGFRRLQDSVWVHPYDCRFVVDLLRIKYRVLGEALYLVVESLDGDRWLRREFQLDGRKKVASKKARSR